VSIPQSFLQELLTRIDVVEVVGRYVQLKKGGANFMGLCPFHGEKSPSFSVSPAKQFYHCFGCGANGNAISFLMSHAGMSFVEAVKDLAQHCGLSVPDDDTPPQDIERQRAQREHQTSLTSLLDAVAKGYQKNLKTSPRAIGYLKGRGLSGEIAHAFGLGYAPEGWRTLASMVPDYADNRLVESGMVIARDDDASTDSAGEGHATTEQPGEQRQAKRYDRFRDRIMFPIRNVKGETIGFGGRVLDKGDPKYLNSPETPVFSKGRELYGLFEARTAIRTQGYALVTEGYMDVVALAQLGFANAVATLGTACTTDHIQKLFRFTEAVVFSFDGDGAGRRAAGKAMLAALPFAQDTRSIKFLFLPPEHDPDSFIRANGTDAFAEQVQTATPLSQFMLESARLQCDMATPEGRARMTSQAKPLWAALPDGALKRQMLTQLATQIGLDAHELTDLWKLTQAGQHPYQDDGQRREAPVMLPTDETRYHSNGYAEPGSGNVEMGSRYKRPWNDKTGKPFGRKYPPRDKRYGPRPAPPQLNTRAELVARILFSFPIAWEWLTPEDHHLLAHLPEPMGPLLGWAESQWHENGAQPWAVLQQAMAGQAFEPMANALMTQAMSLNTLGTQSPDQDAETDARRELREVLWRMLIDDLMVQETLALADAATQPNALHRYRDLYERRCALQRQIQLKKV
jgi:DNA primase